MTCLWRRAGHWFAIQCQAHARGTGEEYRRQTSAWRELLRQLMARIQAKVARIRVKVARILALVARILLPMVANERR